LHNHHSLVLVSTTTFKMGWLWSSTPSASAPAESNVSSKPIPEQSIPPTSSEPAPVTRDEFADKELNAFFAELQADAKPSSTKYNRVSKQAPEVTPSSSSSPDDADLPLSEQLLPRTMSCRNAFDSAFYCNSLGGQFNNLYRYGSARSCSENWDDFWFCMKTRTYGAGEKEKAIMARYRDKEQMKYRRQEGEERGVQKSSEDVWKSRDVKMEWGTAFNEPYEDFDGNDKEWNEVQRARRQKIADGTMG
jgi:hypothetical protein